MKDNKKIKKNIIEGDIFHGNWKEREWRDQKDCCFEGLFMARFEKNKELWLVDTFWGIGSWDNKKWKYADFIKTFNFSYYCNIKELQQIDNWERNYYADDEIFTLHTQHRCSQYYYIKKGTKRNQAKMIAIIKKEISQRKEQINNAIADIENYQQKKIEIEKGNLEICF